MLKYQTHLMVHLSQLIQLLLPIPLGFFFSCHMPILLSLLVCQLLSFMLSFFHQLHCIHLPVPLPQFFIQACEMCLSIFHHLDGPIGLLIRFWVEQVCCFGAHDGGSEKKGCFLLELQPTFYPLAPHVATPENTTKPSHSFSLANCISSWILG